MGDGSFLCVAGIVLLTIMLVGHGMWVVAAWLIRTLGGGESSSEPGKPCRQCGAASSVKQGRCVVCGAVPSVPAGSLNRQEELQATRRQLRRLFQQGSITQQQCDELLAIIDTELQPQSDPTLRGRTAVAERVPHAEPSVQPHFAPVASPPPVTSAIEAAATPIASQSNEAEVLDAILVEQPPLLSAHRVVQPAITAGASGPPAAPRTSPAVAPQPVHPLDRPYVPPPPQPPSQPGRSLADMLQSFMEESNIRWGEILAAMLIVLCSVGLVISLRNTLKNVPYFPAILFTLFTVSFHGAGMYTLRRWKLQTVSRVILIISLLLVPLTFCGAIVMQQSRPDSLFFVALAAGIGIFTWVAYSASRELVGNGAWPLTIGVLGPSLAQVAIHRLQLAGDVLLLNVLAAIPLGSFLIATGWQLVRARQWKQLSQQRVVQILRVLGIALFAVLPPLALILLHGGPPSSTIAHLSPQLSLAAAAALALGLLIHRRTTAKDLAAWQTVGTAILVLAGVLLLLLVAAAWPEPELLLALGLMNCAILAVLGIVAELPLLYVPSVACAALATVIGWHLAGGHFAERDHLSLKIVQAALRGQTSIALTLMGALVGGIGGWLWQRKRLEDALMLLASGGGLAAIAVGVALFSGFVTVPDWPQDRDLAAGILLLFAVGVIASGPVTRRPEVAGGGSLLLWLALVQALVFNGAIRGWLSAMQCLPEQPVLTATLVHGVITAIAALVAAGKSLVASPADFALQRLAPRRSLLAEPLAIGAAISLAAVVPFIAWVRAGSFEAHAVMALVAAAGWAALAASQRWPWAISALQGMVGLAPALLIAGVSKERIGGPNWLFDERHLFGQLIAAALGTLVWSPARRLTSGCEAASRLLNAPWPAVDQVLLGVAAMGLPLVTILVVLPDIGRELSFEPYMRSATLGAAGELPGALQYGWIALAVLLAALVVSLWERVSVPATVGLGVATFAAVSLAAGHFESSLAAASASRWAAAIYALLWGAAYIARDPLRATLKQLPWLRWERFSPGALIWFCAQPLLLGGRAVLILTIIAVYQNANGVALGGPAADSVFAAMGPTVSYAAPLMALVVVLLAYAIRERKTGFALAGAAVSQFSINLAFLLHVTAGQSADLRAIEWLQWNSIAAGVYALVWLGLSRWMTSPTADEHEKKIADGMWLIPVALGGVAAAVLVGWAALAIVERPAIPSAILTPIGSWMSYLAVGLTLAAVVWRAGGKLPIDGLGDAATWLVTGLAPLVAATIHQFDRGGQWLAYHTLEIGWLASSAVACALVCWQEWLAKPLLPSREGGSRSDAGEGLIIAGTDRAITLTQTERGRTSRMFPHHITAALIAAFVVGLAIRGNETDPGQPWWSLGATLTAGAIAVSLGLARRSQVYAYFSTALAGLAVILLWQAPKAGPWIDVIFTEILPTHLAGWEVFVFALTAAAGFWLWREVAYQRTRSQSMDARTYLPRVHAAVVLVLVPVYFVYRLSIAQFLENTQWVDIAAAVVTLALGSVLIGALWDRRAAWTMPLLYVWGATVWCLAIGLARPWLTMPEQRLTALVLAVAGHVALSGQLWSYGANLAALGERLGVSDPVAGLTRTAKWLPAVNLIFAALVCAANLLLVLTLPELPLRVAAAWGPAVVAWGILCLAQEPRRNALQLTALLVAGLTAIYLGWAQIAPLIGPEGWLAGTFRLLMVLAALTFVYGLALPRFLLTSGSWNAATRKAGHIAATLALTTFVVTLALEIALFVPGKGAPVEDVQVAAIAVVLLGLIAGLISLAVLPGRDPLVLSERGRQGYVYAAEITAALLFVHLYVCRPQWFGGILTDYWPFIVMGIAFLGVGAAEIFERLKVRVLAEPLANTGAMLPLLPAIGWWVAGSAVDYSLLLLVAGILYLALSYTRKSWAAMVAAAVAGNGALWALLSNSQLPLAANPQLWLIPPALSVLVAAQVNRRRLTPDVLAGIRYAATIVIYVSSTSEIFTRAAGGLVPPMVLLGLSVTGALVGIALRVRAFLILGSTFTLLALIAMVRHAAQSLDHVWPWWVFGISLGVAVLFLLGVFEKKRAEVTLLIGRLRQWEQ